MEANYFLIQKKIMGRIEQLDEKICGLIFHSIYLRRINKGEYA
jgi:hypothetical protein